MAPSRSRNNNGGRLRRPPWSVQTTNTLLLTTAALAMFEGASFMFLLVISWTLWSMEIHTYRFVKDTGGTAYIAISPIVTTANYEIQPPLPSATPPSTPPEIDSFARTTADGRSDRPLILYAYFETEDARVNLEFFIKHGLHAQADFMFILSGENEAEMMLPTAANIQYIKRQNDCYDMGAYAETLLRDDLYKKYKQFILLNASLRGPFVPYWSKGCWTDMYLNKITDEVKLVGMTANCFPAIHIQSMILATDSIGIEILLFPPPDALEIMRQLPKYKGTKFYPPYPGINGCFHDRDSAISAEVGSSLLMTAAGYKLDVMMSSYHSGPFNECPGKKTDLLNKNSYHGISIHPYETIFVKTNRRKADRLLIDRHTTWTNDRNYSSYDSCKAR